jgi:hypothetical protein
MADDWIKFRKKLVRDGRVTRASRACNGPVTPASRSCNADRSTMLGALVTLWCLADDYAERDGLLPHYSAEDIDAEVGVPGFCSALPADWMEVREGAVYLPNYQAHNGPTAKSRAQAARRAAASRGRVTPASRSRHAGVTPKRTKSAPREEKRRIEKKENTPLPPFAGELAVLDTEKFRAAWADWLKHRKEKRKAVTATQAAKQLAALAQAGEPAAVWAVEESLRRGWEGLFPEKYPAAANGARPKQADIRDHIDRAFEAKEWP